MPWSGTPSNILIVGLGPIEYEDEISHKQFTGPAGQLLKRGILSPLGIHPGMVAFTNAVRCRPPKNNATLQMIELCRPFLYQDIYAINPKKIICLGEVAAKAVMQWRECIIKQHIGRVYHTPPIGGEQWISYPCIITYHPSFALRGNAGIIEVIQKHIRQFVNEEMLQEEFKELIIN